MTFNIAHHPKLILTLFSEHMKFKKKKKMNQ